MQKILDLLNINETYTKPTKLPKIFDSVKENIPLKADYNFMADLLMLPETKEEYKYLLVIDDLATNEFDIEPIKDKEPASVLEAMQEMFKRKYIKEPYASIRTDAGTEFQGVFHQYLHDKSIIHKIGLPNRHKQTSNVERLNKELARLFNGYMNGKEKITGKVYKEWTDVLDTVRETLNKFRKNRNKIGEQSLYTHKYKASTTKTPKYKIGDIVYSISEIPRNAMNEAQPSKRFREGDYRWNLEPRKVVKVLPYPKNVRYVLDTRPNASYAEYELKPAEEKEEEYTIKKIIDKKTENRKVYYLVWWKGYKKANATWEPKVELIKDGTKNFIDDYEEAQKE